jgi:DNA primase
MSHQAGFLNTVAVSGTALTPYQLKMLKRYSNHLFTAFDMDQAGNLATQRSIGLAQEQGLIVRVIVIPKEGSDPAEIISQDPKQWEKVIQSAKTSMEFFFDIAFNQYPKETPEGRQGITKMLIPLIASIDGQIEQAHWVQELGQKMGVDEKSIFQEMEKVSFEGGEEKEEESLPEVSVFSRKEKLERRILGLLLSRKEKKKIIFKKDLDLFSPTIKQLINLTQQGQIDKTKAKSRKVANFLNALEIDLEKEGIEEEKEIGICLRELRNLDTRAHLEEISKQISNAEEKNQNKKVQKLIEKFKKFSQTLIDNQNNGN